MACEILRNAEIKNERELHKRKKTEVIALRLFMIVVKKRWFRIAGAVF